MSSPTYWSQPNQQVVRDGDPVGIVSDDPDPQSAAAGFDPGDHTVAEVLEYLENHPDDEDRIFDLETKGKNRTSIVGSD